MTLKAPGSAHTRLQLSLSHKAATYQSAQLVQHPLTRQIRGMKDTNPCNKLKTVEQ